MVNGHYTLISAIPRNISAVPAAAITVNTSPRKVTDIIIPTTGSKSVITVEVVAESDRSPLNQRKNGTTVQKIER